MRVSEKMSIQKPHEYKPPTFYTMIEGGILFQWDAGMIPLVFWQNFQRFCEENPDIIRYTIRVQERIVHSLLWVRYGDRPEDYVIQERWDTVNGFTYPETKKSHAWYRCVDDRREDIWMRK